MKPPESPETGAPSPSRKPYSTPVLREYGTVRAITSNNDPMGLNSDGSGMFAKTT
jgi:hypothetical protein